MFRHTRSQKDNAVHYDIRFNSPSLHFPAILKQASARWLHPGTSHSDHVWQHVIDLEAILFQHQGKRTAPLILLMTKSYRSSKSLICWTAGGLAGGWKQSRCECNPRHLSLRPRGWYAVRLHSFINLCFMMWASVNSTAAACWHTHHLKSNELGVFSGSFSLTSDFYSGPLTSAMTDSQCFYYFYTIFTESFFHV